MTGLFFDYTGDNRVIDKAVNEQQPLATISNITPYRALSPLNGTIDLTYNATVFSANYCKLGSKYYYITDRELLPGGKMSLVLRCDVLKTFAAGIKSVTIIPARSASVNNPYIIDTRQPTETTIEHYNLLFNGDNFDYTNMSLIGGIVGTGGQPDIVG